VAGVGEVEKTDPTRCRLGHDQGKFYDSDGVRIGEGTADVTEIDAGERVRFTVEGRRTRTSWRPFTPRDRPT